jgi:hypothetical protein
MIDIFGAKAMQHRRATGADGEGGFVEFGFKAQGVRLAA